MSDERPDWTAWKEYLDSKFLIALPAALSWIGDIRSTFQWEHFLHYGLESYFIARKVGLDGVEVDTDPNDYWRQIGYKESSPPDLVTDFAGEFKLTKELKRIALYSIRAFQNPHVTAYTRLPDLTPILIPGGNETELLYYFCGIENGAMFFNELLTFVLRTATGTGILNELWAQVGPLEGERGGVYLVNINSHRPATYNTAKHVYSIIHQRNLTTFKVEEDIALFCVPCNRNELYVQNTQPYSIVLVPRSPKALTPFIELWSDRTAEAVGDITTPLSPYDYRFSDGYEMNTMSLPLYEENTDTEFAGSSIALADLTLTSHAFPISGFTGKTISLMFDQDVNVAIQVYSESGTWRQYDAFALATATHKSYIMEGRGILARVVVTPEAYPCTVNEGSVVLE